MTSYSHELCIVGSYVEMEFMTSRDDC